VEKRRTWAKVCAENSSYAPLGLGHFPFHPRLTRGLYSHAAPRLKSPARDYRRLRNSTCHAHARVPHAHARVLTHTLEVLTHTLEFSRTRSSSHAHARVLTLTLEFSRTHSSSHAHARVLTHTLEFSRTRSSSHAHARVLTHTLEFSRTRSSSHAHARVLTHTLEFSRTHSSSHAHARDWLIFDGYAALKRRSSTAANRVPGRFAACGGESEVRNLRPKGH